MKIAVMGYGTIGSGVVDVLRINKEKITKRAGEPVDVKYILDLREFPGDPMEDKAMPGFYAEDVAQTIPELAVYDGEQVEDWNYRTMIPMLLKLIQSQEKRIRKLEDQIGGRL